MDESMKGLGLVADPNNPFYTPPSMSELILRTLGQAVPPPGRLRVPNGVGGQLLGAAIRVGGGLAGNIGDEQLRQRLDPLARQLAINQQAAQAAQGISVPVSPAQNVPVEGPLQESGAFGTAGSERPIGTIPAITRPPISEYELFAHAPNDKARAILTMAGNPGRFINNPLPAAQLEHVQMQNKKLQAETAVEGLKVIQQQAFANALQVKERGGAIPEHIAAFLSDDQRLQLGLPSKATLQKAQESQLGLGDQPSVGPDRQALAMELGFANFGAMPRERQAEVNKEVKRREDERLALESDKNNRYANQFAQVQSLAERRLALKEEQDRRLLPSQTKLLTTNRVAMSAIDDYAKAYDDFVKESPTGVVSDTFRGAIAKNKNAQRASDLVTAEGRTPTEKQLAAKYNALVGNIRSLTDEVGVLTDVDAVRILGSFDPAQGRDQVRANLSARRKTHQRVYDTQLEDLQAIGKDVSKFVGRAAPGQLPAPPAGAKSGGPPVEQWRRNPITGKLEKVP